ncbi:hypothetical protein MYK68_14000 [Gordonia sp. PP30]|uniref:hypothetical protein n=1 Tax=Gordonia sp. PP30 TaxID=2935861 RepID=UPI001FFE5E88|nr:hypothetical protein [Gordonia sp. PP30]UQE73843.1 hypothetical protein MYK68_14000 [Gordonia sp. PP30]
MSLPARYVIEVRELIDGPLDDFGDAGQMWSEWAPHRIIGWGVPATAEPKTAGHDRVVVDLELYVPTTFPALSHRGQVRLGGAVYDVVGEPERCDGNPFGWNPGGTLNLRRVVG